MEMIKIIGDVYLNFVLFFEVEKGSYKKKKE